MSQAFCWFADGLQSVQDPPPADLVPLLADRRIDSSAAFYGVGAPEIADRFIERGVAEFIGDHASSSPRPRGLRFVSKWAIEIYKVCQSEALHAKDGPEHLFNDICDSLPPLWRKRCGLDGHAASKWSHEDLKRELPYIRIKLKAP